MTNPEQKKFRTVMKARSGYTLLVYDWEADFVIKLPIIAWGICTSGEQAQAYPITVGGSPTPRDFDARSDRYCIEYPNGDCHFPDGLMVENAAEAHANFRYRASIRTVVPDEGWTNARTEPNWEGGDCHSFPFP